MAHAHTDWHQHAVCPCCRQCAHDGVTLCISGDIFVLTVMFTVWTLRSTPYVVLYERRGNILRQITFCNWPCKMHFGWPFATANQNSPNSTLCDRYTLMTFSACPLGDRVQPTGLEGAESGEWEQQQWWLNTVGIWQRRAAGI